MRTPFEIWAPQEIAQLRADADALQRTLDRYLVQALPEPNAPPARAANVLDRELAHVAEAFASRKRTTDIPPTGGRPAKHSHILDMIDQAGPAGLTTDELDRASGAAGRPIKRNSLRSFLWNQRQIGRLILRDGRNVSAKFKNEGEPEGETSNSPDLLAGAA